MTHALTSSGADALLSFGTDDRVRYLRAARGAYFDASSSGWEDGHVLWGPVDVIGDPEPLFRIDAHSDRLFISPAQDVPELVPFHAPKDGAYLAIEGGFISQCGRIETHENSVLYMIFLINPALVFSARGEAIAVTQFTPEPEPSDLGAQALAAAA